jgi:hypothetical protein
LGNSAALVREMQELTALVIDSTSIDLLTNKAL